MATPVICAFGRMPFVAVAISRCVVAIALFAFAIPSGAKDDGAELRLAGVGDPTDTVAGVSIELALGPDAEQAAAVDRAVSAISQSTGSLPTFPKRTSGRSVIVGLNGSVSRRQLAQTHRELQALPGIEHVKMRLPSPKAAAEAADTRQVIGLIVAPTAAAEADGYVVDGALTERSLAVLRDDPIIVIAEVRPMAGGLISVRFESTMTAAAAEGIRSRVSQAAFVQWADLDVIDQPHRVPNDLFYSNQWNLFGPWGIAAPLAWDISTGSPSVVVAILDTGLLKNQPDLSGRWVGGYDMISDPARARDGNGPDADASDPGDWSEIGDCGNTTFRPSSWHGSHVAGIVGAASNNSSWIAGVAWDVRLLPIRVLGRCGGARSDIINGMYWAVGLPVPGLPTNPNPARILNMSLGSTVPAQTCSASYATAVSGVNATGAMIVVAAGNNGNTLFGESGFYEPSGCSGVIAVGASDHLGYRASYSNWSTEFVVDLSAPGGDKAYYGLQTTSIYSTTDIGTRSPQGPAGAWYDGTSQAAPHVAGILALMLSARPSLTNRQLYGTLIETTREFRATSTCYRDSVCGWGIAHAHAAILRATTDPANDPTRISISSSANPVTVGTAYVLTASVVPTNVAGFVTFLYDGSNEVSGCEIVPVVSGIAKCTRPNSAVSVSGYRLSAVYNGDYTHHWAYSPEIIQVVLPGSTATAIEYYHAQFDHYFITVNSDEIAKLDSGYFAGWTRTSQSFKVYRSPQAGLSSVCRFFTLAFPPSSSHFYAPRGLGCEGTLVNRDWQFEGDVFFTPLPSASGACSTGTVPVYRLYNSGHGGAPNHRFTTSLVIRSQMLALGYIAEGTGIGVGMCSPL